MREEVNGEVHRPAKIDVDFLVRFREVEGIDIEGPLHTCVVDEALYFRVVVCDLLDKGGDGGNVAGVEGVAANDDEFFTLGNEVFGHGA